VSDSGCGVLEGLTQVGYISVQVYKTGDNGSLCYNHFGSENQKAHYMSRTENRVIFTHVTQTLVQNAKIEEANSTMNDDKTLNGLQLNGS